MLTTLRADIAALQHRPEVLYPGLIYGLSAGSMFAYVSTSPLLLIQGLGVSPTLYSGLFAISGSRIVAGAFLSGRALHAAAPVKLVAAGLALMLAGPVGAMTLLTAGVRDTAAVVGCMGVATFGYGLIAPAAAHATLDPVPGMAGTASALMNSFQMGCMALSSLIASLMFGWLGLTAPSIVMVLFALLAVTGLHGWWVKWQAPQHPCTAVQDDSELA